MLTLEQARERMRAAARPFAATERVPTQEAGARVLAEAVMALVDVPPYDNAQMDGYAVRCADLGVIPACLPVQMRIAAGQQPGALPAGAAARIFTGAAIPAGCDAVIMQELTRAEGQEVVILQAPARGQFIRRAGSDIALGAVALEAGQPLHAQHLGIAASAGAASLSVVCRPRVALFCTGDELAMPGEAPVAGRIYNSNRFVLAGLLRELGCSVLDLGIVPDTLAATRAAIQHAATAADMIVSSGGVSVGEEDHVKAALESIGQLQMWRIAMKPGKPMAFGQVGTVPFIGLPGNPVSSFVTFVLLVRPFLLHCLGVRDCAPAAIALRADFDYGADPQRREFARARRNPDGGLDLFPSQGAALLSSVAWADGLVDVAPGAGIVRGQMVHFLPFSELTGPP